MNPDRWAAAALLTLSAVVTTLWLLAAWVHDLTTGTDNTDPWEADQ